MPHVALRHAAEAQLRPLMGAALVEVAALQLPHDASMTVEWLRVAAGFLGAEWRTRQRALALRPEAARAELPGVEVEGAV